jgi:hypothetical protein
MAECFKSQNERERFFIGEHEWREAKTWFEAIMAADSADGFNRHREILKADDITLDGAEIDFEAACQFGATDVIARLEDFKKGENALNRVVHKNFYRDMELRQRLSGIDHIVVWKEIFL